MHKKILTIMVFVFFFCPSAFAYWCSLDPGAMLNDFALRDTLAFFTLPLALIGGINFSIMLFRTIKVKPPTRDIRDVLNGPGWMSIVNRDQYVELKNIITYGLGFIFTLVILVCGWLLFVLFLLNIFASRYKMMAIHLDTAEKIIAGKLQYDIDQIYVLFNYISQYAYMYGMVCDTRNENKMSARAEKLITIMKSMYKKQHRHFEAS